MENLQAIFDKIMENEQLKDFIKREELDNLISDRIREEIEKKMSEISFKPTKTKKPVEEE